MVTEAVLGSPIAAGLAEGASTIARRAYEAWKSGEHPLVHDLTVEFTEALVEELERTVGRPDDEDTAFGRLMTLVGRS